MLPGAEIFIIFLPDIHYLAPIRGGYDKKRLGFTLLRIRRLKKNRDLEIQNLDPVFLRD